MNVNKCRASIVMLLTILFACLQTLGGVLLFPSQIQAAKIGPNSILDIANNDQDIYISRTVSGDTFAHLGGVAVGDVNGDGIDDFIASALTANVSRNEYTYLPGDQDEWTEENTLLLWNVKFNGTSPVADPNHVAGSYSISTTRTGSGSVAFQLRFPENLAIDPSNASLHFQVYAEDINEKLSLIKIHAPDWDNRFRYSPSLTLSDEGWTQVDLNISDFFSEDGSPDWNNIDLITLSFWGGSQGDIKIDQFYFDYYGPTITPAGAVYLFYSGLTGDIITDTADVTIYGIDGIGTKDLTGEYITIGDINNDSYGDIMIGIPRDDGPGNERKDAGAVYVIFGNESLPNTIDLKTAAADYIVYGADAGDLFGQMVYIYDINADGISDLIIGALGADGYGNGGDWDGEIHIILGSEGLSGILDLNSANADISIYGTRYSLLGTQATIGVGDIYDDGQVDIIIGVYGGDREQQGYSTNAGKVLIIDEIGSYSGVIDLVSFVPDTIIYGADNGDRLAKIAIGDFNNDGIDDIIVGAAEADGLNNSKTDVGEVYIFFGSSSLPPEIDLNSTNADLRIIGVDAGDNLGLKVYASDISNDGIDDILAIAPGGDGVNNAKSEAGDAYALYGNPTRSGIIDLSVTLPELTVYGADDGDDLRDVFGGDISGDGINDFILGYRAADGLNNAYGGWVGDIIAVNGGGIQGFWLNVPVTVTGALIFSYASSPLQSDTRISNFSITPSADSVDIVIDAWNISGTYYKKWTETAISAITISHTIGDLKADAYYTVKVDNALFNNYLSNSSGEIAFTFTMPGGYSSKEFEVIEGGDTGDEDGDGKTGSEGGETTGGDEGGDTTGGGGICFITTAIAGR